MIEDMRNEILQQLDVSYDVSDDELMEKIREQVRLHGDEYLLTLEQRYLIQKQLFNSFRRLDVLQELLDREDVSEIMVNGCDNIYYEERGQLHRWHKGFDAVEKLENVVQQIAARGNKSINEAEPIVDTRLSDGSRVNIVMSPAAINGPCVTIRKFFREYMSLEHLVENKSISREMKAFFELLVKAGYNMFISGGTGSGKTTFLNALSQAISANERVITIEDSAELQLQGVENLVRLEARAENANGVEAITIRDLIKTSLRMRPDRIIVGEVRGEEAFELLQANNTGHRGSMSTGHGNSCQEMLSRLETMVLMAKDLPVQVIRGQIASGIEILIHLGRLRDKSRKVLQVWEILGVKDGEIILHPLYEFCEIAGNGNEVSGHWVRKGELEKKMRLEEMGCLCELETIYMEGNEET